MADKNILKKLEEIEKQVKSLINQLKNENEQTQELSPIQFAVKTVTCSKSTNQQVKDALQILVESPEPLSVKQVAFCIFFASLNKKDLGEDIDYWVSIELGKHKYSERDSFI